MTAEAVGRARSWALPMAVTLFVVLVGGVALVLFSLVLGRAPQRQPAADDMANVAFFTAAFQLVVVLLAVPALAGPAIAAERERETFDLLRLGALSCKRLVVDKLVASLAPVGLLLVVALPVLLAVFLYAGLDLRQLLLTEVLTFVTAASLGSVAVAFSAWLPRVLAATLAAYAGMLILIPGAAAVGVMLSRAGPGAEAHPLVFANPFYALHAAAFADAEWGAHVGRLVQLAFLGRGKPAVWGPVVQPWHASVLFLLAVGAACLFAASELVAGRRLITRRIGRRRPRALGGHAAVGLVLLIVPLVAAPARGYARAGEGMTRAAGSSLTITAAPRWGHSTVGAWTPYLVTVRNDGRRDIEGEVVLSPRSAPSSPQPAAAPEEQPGDQSVIALGGTEITVPRTPGGTRTPEDFPTYHQPVTVAGGGGRKALVILAVEAPDGYRAEVRSNGGQLLAAASLDRPGPGETVAVLSKTPGAAASLDGLHDPFGPQPGAIAQMSSARDFPDSALLLGGLGCLVLDRFDVKSLSGRQVQALQDFVAFGGSLVLAGGADGLRAVASLPEAIVPLRAKATAAASLSPLADLVGRATQATTSIVIGDLARGRSILQAPGQPPLVVQAEYGAGRVVQLAYDPLDDAMASDPFLRDLAWSHALSTALAHFGPEGGVTGTAPPEQLWSLALEGQGWAPWPGASSWSLVAYAAFVLPFAYGLAARRSRPELLWVIGPGSALVVLATVMLAGQARAASAVQPTVEVRTLGPMGEVLANAYGGVRSTGRGPLRAPTAAAAVSTTFVGPELVADPSAIDLVRSGRAGGVVELDADGAAAVFDAVPGEARNVQHLSVEHRDGLDAQLRLVASGDPELGGLRVQGTIRNRSPRAILKPRAQLPEGAVAQLAPALVGGQTLHVDAPFVWPRRTGAGSGTSAAPSEQMMFAAAAQAFSRGGQVVVAAVDKEGFDEASVMVQPVPLESTERLVARVGSARLVASTIQPDGTRVTAFDLDGLPGTGPLDLRYNRYFAAPEVYDWTTGQWRVAPRTDPAAFAGPAPLGAGEVRAGLVRVRVKGDPKKFGYSLSLRGR